MALDERACHVATTVAWLEASRREGEGVLQVGSLQVRAATSALMPPAPGPLCPASSASCATVRPLIRASQSRCIPA